ncbi:MAG: tetratricopeptide repeat protein [Gemmatimonadetes bacterium]|nr:tetratricopeptide repeat protein [Gemmatimonadota bacterium]
MTWLAPFIIVAAAFGVYGNSFSVPFLYDDIGSIPENSSIRHLGNLGQALSPPRDSSVAGRPILNLSFAVNYAISGLNVWSYHLFNILIHAGAGLALYGVVRRTFLTGRLRAKFGDAASALALITTLLWLVHPLQTESVTYIVQRAEALVGLLYLLLFYCVIRGTEAAGDQQMNQLPRRATAWYGAAVLVCMTGMGSKEVMATAPVLLLLYDRTFLAGTFRKTWKLRRWLYGALALTWIIVPLVTIGARSASAGFSYQGVTPFEYARSQFGIILHYLRLSVWPHPLVFHYGWPVAGSTTGILAAGVVVLGAVAATFWAVRYRPALGFCGMWFFLILAPTSTIVPIADLAYEHRMYLPLAAVIVLLVAGGNELLRRMGGVHGTRIGAATAVLMIVTSGALSAVRNRDYAGPVAIWTDTVAKRPDNYKAQYNLAWHLERSGRVDEAVRHYRAAVEIRPEEREALNALGMLLARSGRADEGIGFLQMALDGSSDPAETHMNLGLIRGMQGRPQEAIFHYQEALRVKPDLATAHFNMANALLDMKREEEAAQHYGEALRIKPDFAAAHLNLASTLAQRGRIGEAVEHFRKALETQPDNHRAHFGVAMALLQGNRPEDARRHLEQALRIRPDFEPARQALQDISAAR